MNLTKFQNQSDFALWIYFIQVGRKWLVSFLFQTSKNLGTIHWTLECRQAPIDHLLMKLYL